MKKLTIVKVLGTNDVVSDKDLEEWREIFANHRMTEEEAIATGKVEIEYLPETTEDEDDITFVRVGDETYKPTPKDLEAWRDVFEDAQNDPDFKIFTHPAIDVEVIPVGKVIAVK